MRRFFIDPVSPDQEQVVLDPEESHHCLRVLRLRPGDLIELVDGSGALYQGVIDKTGRNVTVRLQGQNACEDEPSCPLWVCQGDLKGKKMDELVQRCTELGVTRFLPFSSSRSQGRADRERWERKRSRWQGLIRSACKQSRRLRSMSVEQEQPLADLLTSRIIPETALKIMCWEDERTGGLSDLDWRPPLSGVCLMIGPEGGFAAEEVTLARQRGWTTVGLGNHILRAETATLAAVAVIQHLVRTRGE